MIVLLSFSAISSLIPIILIILLIAAAGGLTRGSSFFDLLGFGTFVGFGDSITKSRLKGLNRGYGEYKKRYSGKALVSGKKIIGSMEKRKIDRTKVNNEIRKKLDSQYASGALSAPGTATMTGAQRKKYLKYATRLEDIRNKKTALADFKKSYVGAGKNKSFFGEKTMADIKNKEFALAVAENAYYFKQFKTLHGRSANTSIKNAKLEVYKGYGRFGTARRYRNDYGNLASLPLAVAGLGLYEYDSAKNAVKYTGRRLSQNYRRLKRNFRTNVLRAPGSTVPKADTVNMPGYFAARGEAGRIEMDQVFDNVLKMKRANTPLVAPTAAKDASNAEYKELKENMPYINRGIYNWARSNSTSRAGVAFGMMKLQFRAKGEKRAMDS